MTAVQVVKAKGWREEVMVQDIAGRDFRDEDSDEVYIQIVGKTSLKTRPRGIGLRLDRRTLSLYIVLGPVCRRLGCKYARGEGALSFFITSKPHLLV